MKMFIHIAVFFISLVFSINALSQPRKDTQTPQPKFESCVEALNGHLSGDLAGAFPGPKHTLVTTLKNGDVRVYSMSSGSSTVKETSCTSIDSDTTSHRFISNWIKEMAYKHAWYLEHPNSSIKAKAKGLKEAVSTCTRMGDPKITEASLFFSFMSVLKKSERIGIEKGACLEKKGPGLEECIYQNIRKRGGRMRSRNRSAK